MIINAIVDGTSDNLPEMDYRKEYTLLGQWIATNIVISLIISAFNTVDYLLENWKKTAVEAAQHKLRASKHKQAAMAAELQALKLQIDPHFIFNNLSVLSELILEDQQLGYEYSEKFARVYRYLLVNSRKDIIAVEEELKFLDSYIFLIEKESRVSYSKLMFRKNTDQCIHYRYPCSYWLKMPSSTTRLQKQSFRNTGLYQFRRRACRFQHLFTADQ
jgi:hypothetical protein